jgi:glycerol uptake facilitator-like aquaporin
MLYAELFTEFLGTFVLCSIILSNPNAIPIGLAVTNMIYFDNGTSKAHFNPAVSTMFFIRGDINKIQYISYVFIQIFASINAHISYKYLIKNPIRELNNTAYL